MTFENNRSFEDSGAIIGISVGQSGQGFLHNKILINFEGTIKEIHLANHHQFICRDIVEGDSYIWDVPKIYLSRLKSVVGRCLKIIKNQEKLNDLLPYSFNYKGVRRFDSQGVYSGYSENSEHGMTCATFVLTVFNSVGLNLLDFENWDERPVEDAEWVRTVLRMFNVLVYKGMMSQEHFENISLESNCAKIRPEEVFSCVYCNEYPMKFVCSSEIGGFIRDYCLGLPSAN